ncbi:MAG TPA: outer membrane protein assembly factor BamD [bacterium]|nr:outer membrane protein assembly factor BamD [bacterium]
MKKTILLLTILAAAPALAQTPTPAGESPQALFDKAKQLFDAKQYQEARDSLGRLVAKYPTESFVPQARILLADLEEDFSSATARFQELAAEYEGSPEGAEAQKDLADRYYLADKYAEAGEAYRDYLAQYPKSPDLAEIHYWLGCAYLAQDQSDPAIEQFKKVADGDAKAPWVSKSRVGLGNAYFKKGQYDQAERQYLRILQSDPGYDELNSVYDKLGQTFEMEKKDHQAYAAYQSLLDRYPNALEAADAKARMEALARVHPDYAEEAEGDTPTPTPTPVGAEPPPEPTGTPAAEAVPTLTPTVVPPARPKPFHVQVGVFSQKAYADKAEEAVRRAGAPVFVVEAQGNASPYPYYKVRSGDYASRAEAEKAAKKLGGLLKQQVIVVEDQGD